MLTVDTRGGAIALLVIGLILLGEHMPQAITRHFQGQPMAAHRAAGLATYSPARQQCYDASICRRPHGPCPGCRHMGSITELGGA